METQEILKKLRNDNPELSNQIDEIEKKLEFADAVLEETGAEIFENEIEHQLGTVWVGNIAISGIETEDL